jgi:hypothetical protein
MGHRSYQRLHGMPPKSHGKRNITDNYTSFARLLHAGFGAARAALARNNKAPTPLSAASALYFL